MLIQQKKSIILSITLTMSLLFTLFFTSCEQPVSSKSSNESENPPSQDSTVFDDPSLSKSEGSLNFTVAVGMKSARITWDYSESCFYYLFINGEKKEGELNGKEGEHLITDLERDTEYTISITAKNKDTSKIEKEGSINIKTYKVGPLDINKPKYEYDKYNNNNCELTLYWLDSYKDTEIKKISIIRAETYNGEYKILEKEIPIPEKYIDNSEDLDKGKTYWYKIQSFTEDGKDLGTTAPFHAETNLDLPSQIKNITYELNGNTILIKWDADARAEQYIIYEGSSEETRSKTHKTTNTFYEFIIDNDNPTREVTIKAKGYFGESKDSKPIFLSLPSLPKITNFKAKIIKRGEATVSFTPFSDAQLTQLGLTKDEVYYELYESDSNYQSIKQTDINNSTGDATLTLTELKADTDYEL